MPKSMPSKTEMAAEWTAFAQNWIARVRSPAGDPSRNGVLDDWMIEAVGDVEGVDVIDLGCGEGRFSRMLASRGARVTGIDLCEPMIAAASAARTSPRETYALGDMENLREVASDSFDLAVSYITLVDVHDMTAALREAFRILHPGGRFVVCNLAPMVTAGNMWIRDGVGTKLHFRLDNYLDESEREMPMCGGKFHNLHRTLSTYINGFLSAGFVLEGTREPFPNREQLAREPSNDDMLRVPLFIIYLLRKPRLAR
jgi:2-polyprenyl-3-methyl-5-hydroxy-6-metoxy-1,4-benzoquinol methylase